MCIISRRSSCALQLYSVLWLCLVRSFQKNLLKIPSLPGSKPRPRAISFQCQRTSAFREQVHADISPEPSCIQLRTHSSSLLHDLSLWCSSNRDIQLRSAPSHQHWLFMGLVLHQPKITLCNIRQDSPQTSFTTPCLITLPIMTILGLLVAMYHKD